MVRFCLRVLLIAWVALLSGMALATTPAFPDGKKIVTATEFESIAPEERQTTPLILVESYPEFSFLLPEMAGNLKFGIIAGSESKWLAATNVSLRDKGTNRLDYRISDPLLGEGQLHIVAFALQPTDGLIVEVKGKQLPEGVQLFWSYGGAWGSIPTQIETPMLKPDYCADNVFSVERTSFTLYYGESMRLKTIHAVMPLTSEIRLSDALQQSSPLAFFQSGKKTPAPALTAVLPLVNNEAVYFCVYRQTPKADYNYFMLPELFQSYLKKH